MSETGANDKSAQESAQDGPKRRLIFRLAPIVVIAAAVTLYFATGLYRYFDFAALAERHDDLKSFVAGRFALALAAYVFLYIAAAALSLPGATILCVLGGLLFGVVTGLAAVVFSATIGATLIFLAVRFAFGKTLRERFAGPLAKMEAGFSENAFTYLLLLRLAPLFPFFVVNIVPAFTRIRATTFMAATFLGIIPGAFAFVSAGAGLDVVLARGGELELKGLLLQPQILLAMGGLSVLALLPLATKKWRANAKEDA